jgi:hypothetical protein
MNIIVMASCPFTQTFYWAHSIKINPKNALSAHEKIYSAEKSETIICKGKVIIGA